MNSLEELHLSKTVKVSSPQELSELLREASESGTPVVPIGGGTCLATGYSTDHDYIGIDLSPLSGIVDYIPTDMTAGFLAGTPIREVRAALAENGQELPIDLAKDDAGTIGGLVATGFAGPRRYSQGTLKDLLIGSEYVRGDGLIAKAGGMTVKNVSGFEISRMLHGSWGSLAVLTRVNLKVIPKPRIDTTLVWRDVDVSSALARQERLLAAFPNASALQSRQNADGWETAIRFTGRESATDHYVKSALDLEGAALTQTDDNDMWVPGMSSSQQPMLVLSTIAEKLADIVDTVLSTGGVSSITASYGTGSVQALLEPDLVTRAQLESLDSSLWMVEGGPSPWKQHIPVWGPVRADQSVAQSIKNQFDPAGILNRDRLFV